jgi:hypothetical protein
VNILWLVARPEMVLGAGSACGGIENTARIMWPERYRPWRLSRLEHGRSQQIGNLELFEISFGLLLCKRIRVSRVSCKSSDVDLCASTLFPKQTHL